MSVGSSQLPLLRGDDYKLDRQSACQGTASSVHASRAALPSHLEGLMLTDAVWVHMTLSLKVTAPGAKVGNSPCALILGLLSVPLHPFRKWRGGTVS